MLVGRIVTDEEFRRRFVADPLTTLQHLVDSGLELSASEIDALMATEEMAWMELARAIDPRIARVSLKPHPTPPAPERPSH